MAQLGIRVSTGETAGSAGTSIQTGTFFAVVASDYGPFTPQLVKSMAAYVGLYGERTATSQSSYDAMETYFQLEGAQAYVQRAGVEGSAAAAKKELETAGQAKTLVVTAKYRGVQGNKIKIEVASSGTELLVTNEATGEALETLKGAKAESYGPFPRETTYVAITEGSTYTAGKTEALKVLASSALSGGTNPFSTQAITAALGKSALEKLPKTLGPGQVAIPSFEAEVLEETLHKTLGEHALANNRVALCDIADSATVATLITNKKTYTAAIAGYMAFFSSSCIIPGVTSGTTRKVSASAVAAALCAQAAKSGNDSAAPAGVQWTKPGQGLTPFVTGFTNTFTGPQMNELAENGINPFAERQSKPVLYDFVSALPRSTDKIFCQFSAARERMHLVWAAEELAEGFMFQTIDGRGQLLAAFEASLYGMLLEQWKANAIFGKTATEAAVVNVREPVNTLTTEQEGQLNAEIRVRLSPYVESMSIVIISSPISEAV